LSSRKALLLSINSIIDISPITKDITFDPRKIIEITQLKRNIGVDLN
jgi:hypothetical protein